MILSLWVKITINEGRFDFTKYYFENVLQCPIQTMQNHIKQGHLDKIAED